MVVSRADVFRFVWGRLKTAPHKRKTSARKTKQMGGRFMMSMHVAIIRMQLNLTCMSDEPVPRPMR